MRDHYVPTEADIIRGSVWDDGQLCDLTEGEVVEGLARIKRDAARAALADCAEDLAGEFSEDLGGDIRAWRDRYYPAQEAS